MIVIEGNPPKKARKDIQFSTVKTRRGVESIPFLGLKPGEYAVKFKGKRKTTVCIVKVWLSMYGWAWQIIRDD
jgi:hypothetical protein